MSELKVKAEKKNFSALMAFVDEEARALGFTKKVLYNINLAAEEAIVNVLNHAYPGEKEYISVVCEEIHSPRKGLRIIVSDRGISFNPLSRIEVDTSQPIEKRPIGGLGIHMIKTVAHAVDYRREENTNILTIVFYLPADTSMPAPGTECSQ